MAYSESKCPCRWMSLSSRSWISCSWRQHYNGAMVCNCEHRCRSSTFIEEAVSHNIDVGTPICWFGDQSLAPAVCKGNLKRMNTCYFDNCLVKNTVAVGSDTSDTSATSLYEGGWMGIAKVLKHIAAVMLDVLLWMLHREPECQKATCQGVLTASYMTAELPASMHRSNNSRAVMGKYVTHNRQETSLACSAKLLCYEKDGTSCAAIATVIQRLQQSYSSYRGERRTWCAASKWGPLFPNLTGSSPSVLVRNLLITCTRPANNKLSRCMPCCPT